MPRFTRFHRHAPLAAVAPVIVTVSNLGFSPDNRRVPAGFEIYKVGGLPKPD